MYLGFLASDVGMLIQLGFHMPQAQAFSFESPLLFCLAS